MVNGIAIDPVWGTGTKTNDSLKRMTYMVRIVGGSDYDNPYAPATPDPLSDKLFGTAEKDAAADTLTQIQAEFQEAQRRQSAPRPRGGAQL